MIRTGSRLASAGAAALWLGLPVLVGASEQAWDQEKATVAAKSFEAAVSDVYFSVKLDATPSEAQLNDVYLVTEDLKSLHRYTQRLTRQLERGDGKAETSKLFDRTLLLISWLRMSMPTYNLHAMQK